VSDYRSIAGDVLLDERTGIAREVVAVYRGEDLCRFGDPLAWNRRPNEINAMHGGGSTGRRSKPKGARS
jgi:hypothetical protein